MTYHKSIAVKSKNLILKNITQAQTFSHTPAIIDHQQSQINLLKPFYNKIDGLTFILFATSNSFVFP